MPETETWTIGRLLTWTTEYLTDRGVSGARLDAEVLLAEARGCARIDLYAAYGEPADEKARAAFRELVRRRAEGTPVAYLVGKREFYSMEFQVTPDVLIPRPETELLVITLLDRLKAFAEANDRNPTVCDCGTGSGVIAVCLAVHGPACEITALDISPAALRIATANAHRHDVAEQIAWVESDLFAGVDPQARFDFVVSNPPYISQAEMATLAPEVRDHEPPEALCAGETGIEVIARLLPQTAERLCEGGMLLFEISPMLEQQVRELVDRSPAFQLDSIAKDLAGHARVVQLTRTATASHERSE